MHKFNLSKAGLPSSLLLVAFPPILLLLPILFALAPQASAADEKPLDLFEGRIVKVVPAQREIYVYGDGQKNEYYFTSETIIVEGGEVEVVLDLRELA